MWEGCGKWGSNPRKWGNLTAAPVPGMGLELTFDKEKKEDGERKKSREGRVIVRKGAHIHS